MTDAIYSFDEHDLNKFLDASSEERLNALDFGVIGFDRDAIVRRYNAFESQAADLSPELVIGKPLFTNVASCINNFLVAQRFADALDDSTALDDTINYVLTLRMRPIKVKLRLLAGADSSSRYVLVQRR